MKCFPRLCKFEEEKSAYLSQILFQLFNYKILQLVSFFWPLKGEWIAKFVLQGICIVGNYCCSYHNLEVRVLLHARKQFRGSVHRGVCVSESLLELAAPCFNSLPTFCDKLYCNPGNFLVRNFLCSCNVMTLWQHLWLAFSVMQWSLAAMWNQD